MAMRTRPGDTSEQFPDEALRWLLLVVVAVGATLIVSGLVIAATSHVAAGVAMAVLGVLPLATAALLR